MRVPVKSFVSNTTVFVAGKNFKEKQLIECSPDATFIYDLDYDKLYLVYKGNLRILNGDNVAYWEPLVYADILDMPTPAKAKPIQLGNPGKPIKAQVEVPHEKVQNPPTRRGVNL